MMGNPTTDPPLPLAPAVESLLAHERVISAQPERVRARALSRARASLGATELAVRPMRTVSSPARRVIYAAAASLVLVAGGAAAYQMLRTPAPPPTRPLPPDRPSRATHAVAQPASPTPAPMIEPDQVAPAVKAAVPLHRGSLTPRSPATPEELRLLVRARHADARAEYPAVLSVLSEHERNFPTGRLSEEREVLRVKALVGLGRADEARQVASSFRRHFPRSVLLHKIDDMLATLR